MEESLFEAFKNKDNAYKFIRHQISIAETIGSYTDLRFDKIKMVWQGECPLCYKKELTIDSFKQSFYCFNCKKGGDIVAFIALKEDMNQEQAFQHLMALVEDRMKHMNKILEENEKNSDSNKI